MTREELKNWVFYNGWTGTKYSPGMEKRIEKNTLVKESLLYHTQNICDIKPPYLCERMLYIIRDIYEQKICPVCKTPIILARDTCSKECMNKNPSTKTKRVETCLEKYGYENPSYAPEIKNVIGDKIKLTAKTALEKRKQTNINNIGTEFYLQTKEFADKAKKTCIIKYGVDNFFKSEESIINNKIRLINRTPEERKKRYDNTNRNKFKHNFLNKKYYHYTNSIPLFTEHDWELCVSERKYLCLLCNKEFFRYSENVKRCTHCFPIRKSIAESELINFLKEIYTGVILDTDRVTIKPIELDITIPEKNLAIEFNGLYWHSYGPDIWEVMSNEEREDKLYHYTKTQRCNSVGVQLLHIFEHEWMNDIKKKIWKSIIMSKMGKCTKIYARQCIIKEIVAKDRKQFFGNNHLQGDCNSSVNVALYQNDEIVCLLSIGKPRYNKNYDWEIIRFANKINTSVIGGFSKLLKYFRMNYSGTIITYADKRYSNGNLYRINSFVELKDTKPNYFYTKPREMKVESRIQFQKHKLKDKLELFDENLTESKNMFNNGWRRIWDCGNKVFELV